MIRAAAVGVLAAAALAVACAGAVSGRYVAQLRRLERPSDDEIEGFAGPVERLVPAFGRAAGALERRDVLSAPKVVQESQRLVGDAQAAGRYGLEECRAFAALVPS
jgi:hypothetical protein